MSFLKTTAIQHLNGSTPAINLSANNNVGIGTTPGTRKLSVYATDDTPAYFGSATNNAYLQLSGSSDMYLGSVSGAFTVTSGGAERMRVDTSGRVTMPNQASALLYYNDTSNLGTSGLNYINSSWTYPFPFAAALSTKGGISIASDGTRNSRITVPVTGRYFITTTLFLDINQSIRAFGGQCLVNGGVSYNFTWSSFSLVQATTHPSTTWTFMADLAANDYLTMRFTAYDSPGYYKINQNSYLNIMLIG